MSLWIFLGLSLICQDVWAQLQCSLECPPGTRRSSYDAVIRGEGGTISSETCETHCEAISVCVAPGVPRVTRNSYTCEPVDGYSRITPDPEVDWAWATFEVVTNLESGHCVENADCGFEDECMNGRCGHVSPRIRLGPWESGHTRFLCTALPRNGKLTANIWSIREEQWNFSRVEFPDPIPPNYSEEPTTETHQITTEIPRQYHPVLFEDGERWVHRQDRGKVFVGSGETVREIVVDVDHDNQRTGLADFSPDGGRVAVIRSHMLYNGEIQDSETFLGLEILDAELAESVQQVTFAGTESGLLGGRAVSKVLWVSDDTLMVTFITDERSPVICEVSSLVTLTLACTSSAVRDVVRVRGSSRLESRYLGRTEAGNWVFGANPLALDTDLGHIEAEFFDAYFATIMQTPVMVVSTDLGHPNTRVFGVENGIPRPEPVVSTRASCVIGDHILNMTQTQGGSLEISRIWNL